MSSAGGQEGHADDRRRQAEPLPAAEPLPQQQDGQGHRDHTTLTGPMAAAQPNVATPARISSPLSATSGTVRQGSRRDVRRASGSASAVVSSETRLLNSAHGCPPPAEASA